MIKHLVLLITVLLSLPVFSQTAQNTQKVSITVLNEKNAPLEGATAELRLSKDSAIVKTAVTDNIGFAEFDKVPAGSYLVKITSVNYQNFFTKTIEVTDAPVVLPAATLIAKAISQLQDVTVTARRPFIQN
jgi:hypothetical protein